MPVVLELPASITQRRQDGPRDGVVVGVDGGGTKTLAASLDLSTGAVRTARTGPANPDSTGLEAAVSAIAGAVAGAADVRADVRAVLIAGAGTDTAALAAAVGAAVPGAVVVNDVVAAWAAVAGGQPAIAMIAGTGSNCLGVDAHHRARRAGGWGHVFGDEGSGHWLGAAAVGAAVRAFDGREPATLLGDLLCGHVGAADVGAAVTELYARGALKADVAALAPLVSRAAEQGDATATALLQRAGRDLAAHVVAVADALGLDGRAAIPVGMTGSTWNAGGGLVDAFRQGVAERLPDAPLVRVDIAPVAGSLALALHACGRTDAVTSLLPGATAALDA